MSSDKSTKEHENAAISSLPELHKTTGWRITTSIHARSQAHIRHPNKTSEDWQSLHRNVVHGLIKSKDKHDGSNFIHSTSHGHSVVAHVNHRRKEVHIVTVLDKGMLHATEKDDHKMTVENCCAMSFKEFMNDSNV